MSCQGLRIILDEFIFFIPLWHNQKATVFFISTAKDKVVMKEMRMLGMKGFRCFGIFLYILGMSGRLVHKLEYHYSDGAFGEGSHVKITIRYYGKMD